MSLRWRVVVGLALIAALVTAAGSAAAYVSTSRKLHSSVDESLLTRAADTDRSGPARGRYPDGPGQGPGPGGDWDGAPGDRRGGWEGPCSSVIRPPMDAAQLVAGDGTVTVCGDGFPALPLDPADQRLATEGGSSWLRTVSLDGVDYRLLTVGRSGGGALQLARDLTEVEAVLGSLRWRLTALAVAGVAAASLLGWLVARRIVRPVERLRDAAEHIARTQDLGTPLPAGGSGEVGSLTRSMGTMVGALATSRDQQQRLISDASHELRTPLTSLRTNVELLRRADDLPADQRREVLADLQFEVEELTHLVTELVELATDRQGRDEPVEAVSLAELARSVAARAERRTGRPVTVREASSPPDVAPTPAPVAPRPGGGRAQPPAAGPEDGVVEGRPQLLERAIANLVDNALKYSSPAGGAVLVDVARGRLEVLDRGPGIPAADQPRVFDRFYRSSEARTEPGSGLGLAIVRQIVEGHGGRVWAQDRPGGGAAVGFELPTAAVGFELPTRDGEESDDVLRALRRNAPSQVTEAAPAPSAPAEPVQAER